MKMKYVFGSVLLTAVMMTPAFANNCFLTPPLEVILSCSSHNGCGTVYANVSGGVTPYTYQWAVSGGTIDSDYGSEIDYTSIPGCDFTAHVWVTDDCGNTKLASFVCDPSSGSGGTIKRPDPAPLEMTVGQILDWLYEVKNSEFDIIIKGSTFQRGLYRGDMLDAVVVNVKDEGDRITLYLETDNAEPVEFDHAIIER